MIQKTKISELPLADTLVGLSTIGVDAENKSVQVSLEFVSDAAAAATDAAAAAVAAINEINSLVGDINSTLDAINGEVI